MDLIRELQSNPALIGQLQHLLASRDAASITQRTPVSSSLRAQTPALTLAASTSTQRIDDSLSASSTTTWIPSSASAPHRQDTSQSNPLAAVRLAREREARLKEDLDAASAAVARLTSEKRTAEESSRILSEKLKVAETRIAELEAQQRSERTHRVSNEKVVAAQFFVPQHFERWIDKGIQQARDAIAPTPPPPPQVPQVQPAARMEPTKRTRPEEEGDVNGGSSNRRWYQGGHPPVTQHVHTPSLAMAAAAVASAAAASTHVVFPAGGSSARRPPRPAGVRTPRTPSLTEADRAHGVSRKISTSHSIGLGSTPMPAAVAIDVAPIPTSSTVIPGSSETPAVYGGTTVRSAAPRDAYASSRAAQQRALYSDPSHSYRTLRQLAHDIPVSPMPVAPDMRARTWGAADDERSHALSRYGVGGSEAASRGASSVASSIRDPITMPFRPPGYVATRSPSPANPKRGPMMERCFITSTLDEREKNEVFRAIATLRQGATMIESDSIDTLPDEVTHVVVNSAPRSLKALCALVTSRWIVKPRYVTESLESGFWLDEADCDGMRIHPPPLDHVKFFISIEPGPFRDLVEKVILFGNGLLVSSHRAQYRTADVVEIATPQDLLDYCMQRYHEGE